MVISLLLRLVNAVETEAPGALVLTQILFLLWFLTDYRRSLPFLFKMAEKVGVEIKWYSILHLAMMGFWKLTPFPKFVGLPDWVNVPISIVVAYFMFVKPKWPRNGKKRLSNAWKRAKQYLAWGMPAPAPSPA